MANLDSVSKRTSSLNYLKPYGLTLVIPDGTIAQEDRWHVVWSFFSESTTPVTTLGPIRNGATRFLTSTFTTKTGSGFNRLARLLTSVRGSD